MSFRPATRSSLALGAALLACPLAASTAHGQMSFTTVESASGYLQLGGQSASFTVNSPTNYLAQVFGTDQGGGSVGVVGGHAAGMGDFMYAFINLASSNSTSGSGSGFFTLTFSSRVQFIDMSAAYGMSVAWSVGSVAFTDGDFFEAGTHTIDWSFSGPFASAVSSYGPFLLFSAGSPGAVPLPGAAALAACGLLAAGRRRRR